MSIGVNKVTLVGYIGQDPEVRKEGQVVSMSIGTSWSSKNKETEEYEEKTEWHRVVCFSHTAKYAANYLEKGTLVYIEGRLKTDKYQVEDGTDRYSTSIVVQVIKGLRRPKDKQEAGNENHSATAHQNAKDGTNPRSRGEHGPQIPDDDIPF